MIKSTTQQNLLIRELYAENVLRQSEDFKVACMLDNTLDEEFGELEEIKNLLNDTLLQPSEKCLNQILMYSKTVMTVH